MLLQSYSGRWWICNDDAALKTSPVNCVGAFLSLSALRENEAVQILRQRSTVAPFLNFDGFNSGLYSLLVLASQDGWSSLFDNAHGWSAVSRGRLSDPQFSREQSHNQWPIIPLLLYQYFLYICFWPATVAVYISTQRMCNGSALELAEQKRWRRSVQLITAKYSLFIASGEVQYGR